MRAYITQISRRKIGNKTVKVANLTPELSAEERQAAKLRIEQRLYEIFLKYYPQAFKK